MSVPPRPRPLQGVYLFLAGLWTGALTFFAAAAGIVLRTAPTRADGGVVNRALLDALDVGSLVLAAALLVLLALLSRGGGWSGTSRAIALRLLLLGAVAAFVSLYLITPEMVALRSKAGPLFESLPAVDPLRRAWGRLHALSSLTLLVRIVSAAVAFSLGLSAGRPAEKPVEPGSAAPRDTA
ncbi:MAG: DUF4149 domain-containing protein [Thermoanaerobaculia bacterium]